MVAYIHRFLHVHPRHAKVRANAKPESGWQQSRIVMTQFKDFMRESLFNAFSPATLKNMKCLPEYVPVGGDNEDAEGFETFQLHGSFLWKFLKHVARFQDYHFTVPFCCNVFLDMSTSSDRALAEEVIQRMKTQWTFILEEEKKGSKWLKEIHLLRWQVFRELHTMLEEEEYKATPPFLRLVSAYFPGRQNTIGLEHTFGALRDAETRHSKHKQASNAQIAANCIRTTNNLFRESNKVIEPSPSSISQIPSSFSQGLLRHDCLNPCKAPLSDCGITNAQDILKQAEHRTNAFNFVQKGLFQLRAHQLAFMKGWTSTDHLWVAAIIPEGAVSCYLNCGNSNCFHANTN